MQKKEDQRTESNNNEEQKLAVNPNPRANENIKTEEAYTEGDNTSEDVGSEITDGEDA